MTSMEVTSATSTPIVTNNVGLPQKIALAGMRFLTDALIKKYFPNQEKTEVIKFFSAVVPEAILFVGEALFQARMKPTTQAAVVKNPDDMKILEEETESSTSAEQETLKTPQRTENAEIAQATIKKMLKLAHDNL